MRPTPNVIYHRQHRRRYSRLPSSCDADSDNVERQNPAEAGKLSLGGRCARAHTENRIDLLGFWITQTLSNSFMRLLSQSFYSFCATFPFLSSRKTDQQQIHHVHIYLALIEMYAALSTLQFGAGSCLSTAWHRIMPITTRNISKRYIFGR